MIITKVEIQKKDENRSNVYIDDKFAFGISNVDVLFYKLKENTEISEEKTKQGKGKLKERRREEKAVGSRKGRETRRQGKKGQKK